MQLLIVHRDAELGEQLVTMVKEYTEHSCSFAASGTAALEWASTARHCSLLITQLDGEGVNGLSLGGSLSEMFAGLQTMFLPGYAAAEQRLEVPHAKAFPEPIDGQRLLDAIAHAETQRQVGLDLYHALDVIQMCCLSGRSGALQLVRGATPALIYLQSGNVVHAECEGADGVAALDEICRWEAVEFAYDYALRAPTRTIESPWDQALVAAVAKRKQDAAIAATVATVSEPRVAPSASAKTSKWGLFGGSRKVGIVLASGLAFILDR